MSNVSRRPPKLRAADVADSPLAPHDVPTHSDGQPMEAASLPIERVRAIGGTDLETAEHNEEMSRILRLKKAGETDVPWGSAAPDERYDIAIKAYGTRQLIFVERMEPSRLDYPPMSTETLRGGYPDLYDRICKLDKDGEGGRFVWRMKKNGNQLSATGEVNLEPDVERPAAIRAREAQSRSAAAPPPAAAPPAAAPYAPPAPQPPAAPYEPHRPLVHDLRDVRDPREFRDLRERERDLVRERDARGHLERDAGPQEPRLPLNAAWFAHAGAVPDGWIVMEGWASPLGRDRVAAMRPPHVPPLETSPAPGGAVDFASTLPKNAALFPAGQVPAGYCELLDYPGAPRNRAVAVPLPASAPAQPQAVVAPAPIALAPTPAVAQAPAPPPWQLPRGALLIQSHDRPPVGYYTVVEYPNTPAGQTVCFKNPEPEHPVAPAYPQPAAAYPQPAPGAAPLPSPQGPPVETPPPVSALSEAVRQVTEAKTAFSALGSALGLTDAAPAAAATAAAGVAPIDAVDLTPATSDALAHAAAPSSGFTSLPGSKMRVPVVAAGEKATLGDFVLGNADNLFAGVKDAYEQMMRSKDEIADKEIARRERLVALEEREQAAARTTRALAITRQPGAPVARHPMVSQTPPAARVASVPAARAPQAPAQAPSAQPSPAPSGGPMPRAPVASAVRPPARRSLLDIPDARSVAAPSDDPPASSG